MHISTQTRYQNVFEDFLEQVAAAEPPHKVLKDLKVGPNYLAWVAADEVRKGLFYDAQQVATEHLASQILELTQNPPAPEDIYFVQNKIKALQYLMGCWSRQRYGDIKQVEITNTVDITSAMDQANQRLASMRTLSLTQDED